MAQMFNCAQDWTYDLFFEDMRAYKAGEQIADDYRKGFVEWLFKAAKKYEAQWVQEYTYTYVSGKGYVGDGFAATLGGWFSDYYKDAYGQRPHLPNWFYVRPCELPQEEDTARLFCADPIEDAIEMAQQAREAFEVEDDYEDDTNLEMGFDPYLGCYTEDC